MDKHIVSNPTTSEDAEAFGETDTARKWQLQLSNQKRQCAKMKRRMRNCQATLEKQNEKIKRLQEQIARVQHNRTEKAFNWSSVKAAHLISKVFEKCEQVVPKTTEIQLATVEDNNLSSSKDQDIKSEEESYAEKTESILLHPKQERGSKCAYTVDFHRFAIALYFFSPTTYFFLSNLIPIFPHQNYIRQWVTAGRVDKLFPRGVFREDFNEP